MKWLEYIKLQKLDLYIIKKFLGTYFFSLALIIIVIVVFDYNDTLVVSAEDQKSKCGWTPYEGETLRGVIREVYINGIKTI